MDIIASFDEESFYYSTALGRKIILVPVLKYGI
jgi:hypothetical protein